jgi:hypothetical protein
LSARSADGRPKVDRPSGGWFTLFVVSLDTSSTVPVAPDVAFDAMADARNETKWNSKVTRSELVSGEPIGRGSRFETVNRGQTYDATITEYDRPSRITFEVTGKQMDITSTFTFTGDAQGTALQGAFDFRPKGALKVLFPLIRPMIKRDLPKQMQSFSAFCTSR